MGKPYCLCPAPRREAWTRLLQDHPSDRSFLDLPCFSSTSSDNGLQQCDFTSPDGTLRARLLVDTVSEVRAMVTTSSAFVGLLTAMVRRIASPPPLPHLAPPPVPYAPRRIPLALDLWIYEAFNLTQRALTSVWHAPVSGSNAPTTVTVDSLCLEQDIGAAQDRPSDLEWAPHISVEDPTHPSWSSMPADVGAPADRGAPAAAGSSLRSWSVCGISLSGSTVSASSCSSWYGIWTASSGSKSSP
mmetsp:Transcript_32486/g.82968  ORF Transcript_32486/g.82968 Transcript_32486/m.82968 type:complete len:244 (+) Transcript_32486:821-1552(+)